MPTIDSRYVDPGRKDFNMEIDGYSIFAEEVTGDESFNRRETNRQKIMGGTEFVSRTNYIPRQYEFVTHLFCPKDRPNVYDELFRDWSSRPVEIVSPDIGGYFWAELQIKRHRVSPMMLEVNFTAIEIPDTKTNIPGDTFTLPRDTIGGL